jgi:ceramide glucosyltransferase
MAPVFLHSVAILTSILALAGVGYFVAALIAALRFLASRRASLPAFSPDVTILKSLKGNDPGMLEAFRGHCRQAYKGDYELLFGVSTMDDPATEAIRQLQTEFPERAIRLVVCPDRLGTNGKVSTLVQLAPHARFDFLLINDSDIAVSTHYLDRVMSCFGSGFGAGFGSGAIKGRDADSDVGMVTTLYRGRAHGTLPSRLEALGIATDFQSGVLLDRMIAGKLSYGLGATLAVRRTALEKIGGLEVLLDYLADDYELGARIARAGYRVELSTEVVETGVPAYEWSGFFEHQIRWSRTVRDASPGGYVGLIFTHGLAWALLNLVTNWLSPLSLWLLGVSMLLRLALAMTVGRVVLNDRQVLPGLWLLPVRDLLGLGIWVAGFAGNRIVWRGEHFRLKNGKLHKRNTP